MPWVNEEDELVKLKLQGMIVTDQKMPGGRPVKVWFRQPEGEIRQVEWPYVTIDLLSIAEGLDRAHRGGQARPTTTTYGPEGLQEAASGKTLVTEWPVAMDFFYQVTTWTRSAQHDRQLSRQMWAKFPGRYGSVGGQATPYVRPRSCQLLGWTQADRIDEFGKRLFSKAYTLKVFSELWTSDIVEVTQITDVDIDITIDVPDGSWFSDISCHE